MIQKTLLLISILTLSSFAHSQDWYAMARHGECRDLAEFSKNSGLIIGAKTPEDVEIKLNKAGVKYTLKRMIEDQDGMLNLTVLGEGWAMMLVKKKYCQEFAEKPG